MRWVRRIWDGPFRTPPLAHPVTVGWVLLKTLETFWRLFVLLLVALFIAGVVLWWSERNPLKSQIAITLDSSSECRADGYPIHGSFENKSRKVLGEIDVAFRVYPQGTSEDVATYSGSHHELRSIVRPGRSVGYCFALPSVEDGSTGPYTVAAEVTYASVVSKDVPLPEDVPPIIVEDRPASHRSKTLASSVGSGAIVGLFFLLLWTGGYGLACLTDRIFGTKLKDRASADAGKNEQGCWTMIVLGFANVLFVYLLSYGLVELGWYGWVETLDRWSRTTWLADGAVMLLTAIAIQWPWPILATIGFRKPEPI